MKAWKYDAHMSHIYSTSKNAFQSFNYIYYASYEGWWVIKNVMNRLKISLNNISTYNIIIIWSQPSNIRLFFITYQQYPHEYSSSHLYLYETFITHFPLINYQYKQSNRVKKVSTYLKFEAQTITTQL